MPIEIGGGKPRPIDFTYEGKALSARKMPLSLGLKMHSVEDDGYLSPDIIAEFISSCVVYEDGGKVWSPEEILELDATSMMSLFSEASGIAVSIEEAEKN